MFQKYSLKLSTSKEFILQPTQVIPMTSQHSHVVHIAPLYYIISRLPDVESILCSQVKYSSQVDIIDKSLIRQLRLIILVAVFWHILNLSDLSTKYQFFNTRTS